MPQNKKENEVAKTPSDLFLRLEEDETLLDYSYTAQNEEFELLLPIIGDEPENESDEEPAINKYAEDPAPSEEEKEYFSRKKEKKKKEASKKSAKKDIKNKDKKEKKTKKSDKKTKKKEDKDKTEKKKEKSAKKTAHVFPVISKVFIILISLVLVLGAAYHHYIKPAAEARELEQKQAMTGALVQEIFGNDADFESVEPSYRSVDELYKVTSENITHPLGYCALVSPEGKNGEIGMMVGVSFSKTVIGIKVLSHSEDEKRGAGVLSGEYLSNYIGLWGDSIPFEEDINAVSSATVTSRAVNDGINSALSVYNDIFTDFTKPDTLSVKDAMFELFGWIYDEHKIVNTDPTTHPFRDMYALSVRSGDDNKFVGYAAQVKAVTDSGSADLLIGIYYDTILGVKVLDYEGSGFSKLASDTEYLELLKTDRERPADPEYGVSIPEYPEQENEARAVIQKASEALEFYSYFYDSYNAVSDEAEVESEVEAEEETETKA